MKTTMPMAVRHWPAESRDVVAGFLDLGWTPRVSRRGHVILHAPDGSSTESVSRNPGGLANARSDLRRWQRAAMARHA